MVNSFKKLIVLTASVMAVAGCLKEESNHMSGAVHDGLSFTTSVILPELEPNGTKGNYLFKDVDGNVILCATSVEQEMPNPLFLGTEQDNMTKATLVSDENFADEYGSFWVNAYRSKAQFLDIQKLKVLKPETPETLWSFEDAKNRLWPGGAKLEMFSWAPTTGGWDSDPVFAPGDGDTATATVESYAISDPQLQKDILLGYYYGTGQPSASSPSTVASMAFSHPLTAIKIVGGEDLEDLVINSIKITGIAKSGKLVTTFGESVTHEWSGITTGDWEKSFDPAIEPSSIESELGTLLTIPQTFAEGSKLTLNINVGDIRYNISFPLDGVDSESHPIVDWRAGKIYTLTLNYPGTPNLTVEDNVQGNVKKELVITNTGDCKAWIRATIVGYWCKVGTDDNIASWTGNGTFVNLATTSKWEHGEDGYYYYLDPVEPRDNEHPEIQSGEVPQPLFESFTAPTTPADTLYLKMFIVSQAIKYDADKALVKQAWGDNTPITK